MLLRGPKPEADSELAMAVYKLAKRILKSESGVFSFQQKKEVDALLIPALAMLGIGNEDAAMDLLNVTNDKSPFTQRLAHLVDELLGKDVEASVKEIDDKYPY